MTTKESAKIFDNGATWIRADFHLHTRSDKEFLEFKGTDSEFITAYTKQLEDNDIRLGIITNHNKFNKLEFVELKKHARKKDIGLFAGVEFSLKEGIHVLIVFDDKWYQGEIDRINKFLENAFYGIPHYDKPDYPNSRFGLKETVEALDEIGIDYFLILAHIDEKNGLFEVLKGRTKEAFIQQDAFRKVLAVQKSANIENYSLLCKLANDRKIACVEGSDNAKGGIEMVGNGRVTFIKIGDFNFEALKYSLTDCEYRVCKKKKPETKNSYIKSIAFEGGLLDSTKIDFSPELNNLIGIRGSGKSSILEILRYTLGIPLSEISIDRTYKNGLIEHVLKSGGKAIVTIVDKHNDEYRIEKIYGQKSDIFKDGSIKTISLDAIFDHPVYFGQKDLSNKDADFEADLIKRLIGTRLRTVQSNILAKKSEIEHTLIEIRKLRSLNELKTETEILIKNATHQLDIYKTRGVEEKLKQQTLFDSDISKIQQTNDGVLAFINDLANLVSNHDYFFYQDIAGSDFNSEFFEAINNLILELREAFQQIKTVHTIAKNVHQKTIVIFNQVTAKKEGLKEEFAKIKREINTDTINPDNFLKLNRQIDTALLKLKEIEKSQKKREELLSLLNLKLSELNDLWLSEYRLLKSEVDRINLAEDKLRIDVEFKGRTNKYFEKLKQIFKGTGIFESSYHKISEAYPDFIEIYKDWSKLKNIINDNQMADFKRRFSENVEDLLTYQVENKITINYNGKPLEKHSLGQRASALILFLLAQKDNDVLIIDQPEDDLDNQTIYDEVIKEIKKIKGNMQFIFATHNANIPVLGDSEKVVACQYDERKIEVHSGTIDNHQTQRYIVDIMEGGDEAFNRRKNIYSIWNIEEKK